MSAHYTGQCHCGNISLDFHCGVPPEQARVRECSCSFCRKHGVRSISNAAGSVRLRIAAPDRVTRYRFGLGTADFLVCGGCGVYVAAVLEDRGDRFASINLNVLERARDFTRRPLTISYEGENVEQRLARRRSKWTPVESIAEG